MNIPAVLLLLVLMPIVSFAPGFVLVRRMRRWSPLERFAASIAASIVLVYLVAFLIYNTLVPWRLAWIYTGVAAAALAIAWQDVRRLFGVPQVRRVALLFGALFAWNLLMLAIVRHYVGAFWGPDWFEHYERSLHFVDRGPDLYRFLGLYLLPARPPLMNLFSAFFLAQVGKDFVNYQLTFAFLNLLPFVGLALVLPLMMRRGRRAMGLLAALLACNPMFMQNAQFAWTKSAIGFFVAVAIWFYVVGWRRNDPVRLSLAFLSLSAGVLVHYSGAPYLVVFGLHYLVWVLPHRRWAIRKTLVAVLPGAMLLLTWFGYSLSAYGAAETFIGNTAVSEAKGLTPVGNVAKIAMNIVDTAVPHPVRGYWIDRTDDPFRSVVDNAFQLYQSNLFLVFGLAGCVLVPLLFVRCLRQWSGGAPPRERTFWMVLVAVGVTLSLAVIGPRDHYGVAHIGMQPIVQLGLALLAVGLPSVSQRLRRVLIAGLAVDVALGIAAHLYLEGSVEEWAADYNLEVKNANGLVFLGDWMTPLAGLLQASVWALFVVLLARTYRMLQTRPLAVTGATSENSGPFVS